MNDNINNIIDFDKNSWAIKSFASEIWGGKIPCPLRMVVNPYFSCSHRCAYCYVWASKPNACKRPNFRKALEHDIARAKEFGITNQVIELSASTDPFQSMEKNEKESQYAIKKLLDGGFKVLIITKNPAILLHKEYEQFLQNKNVFIDVSIASLKEGTPDGSIFNYNGPSALNKLEAAKNIILNGKDVRIRIDPVIPTVPDTIGQSPDDLKALVEQIANIGAKLVISKTMRLSADMHKNTINQFLGYYKKNGSLVGSNYVLLPDIRRNLLQPIYENCKKHGINFCPCCDADVFSGDESTATCLIPNEPNIFVKDIG